MNYRPRSRDNTNWNAPGLSQSEFKITTRSLESEIGKNKLSPLDVLDGSAYRELRTLVQREEWP